MNKVIIPEGTQREERDSTFSSSPFSLPIVLKSSARSALSRACAT